MEITRQVPFTAERAGFSIFFLPPRSSYTPQSPRLFTDTIQDNILMGLEADEALIEQAVHQAVMERDLHDMSTGLQTMVGTKGARPSGGQVQRTAAARMFVRQPELLVFDDLSSALDVETERLLWERTFENAETTCLVVSHRKSALLRADHIILLQDGKVAAEGTLQEMLATNTEMQKLWSGIGDE
ncbi:ATP-binding cassette domain-containing protein [Tumebacillus algifaecis]|uniref:ATP-binding cassette domain-containing protein n=1 Tax=Tumebacillus algifaecis TaxID=1214604 RepID=UPI001D131F05|nr:ABC transporter ATP-binding protein [Tumebacillus algifaecis]